MENIVEKNNDKPNDTQKINRTLSIAPMMGWTDRHFRFFARLITPNSLLYSVMITTGALLHGDRDFFLKFNNPEEKPVALQLGGNNPAELAKCAKFAEDAGYDEVNLNCGCPSDRVQRGSFGACLMKEANLVADCIKAMQDAVSIDVTVKNRLGVDEFDSYDFLVDFIGTIADIGNCRTFIIHARKAWLRGLSPKENREIPPLNWQRVRKLKADFPKLEIITNGGFKSIPDIEKELKYTNGIMIGREAYKNPYFMAKLEEKIFKNKNILNRKEIVEKLIPYIEKELKYGTKLSDITRHILGLFQGVRGAKKWRQILSNDSHQKGAGIEILLKALKAVEV